MEDDTFLWIYPTEFLARTAPMTSSEVGAYVFLMFECERVGGLPNDMKRLRKIARGSVSGIVLDQFERRADGKLYHRPK